MLAIFTPVFTSVWKRKETKIYLLFALLYPALVLFASYLPKESNFLQPSLAEGAEKFNFAIMHYFVLTFEYDLVVPLLALFYLTFTVFKGEITSHTLFLYKDMKRQSIFWAKLFSLMSIVGIFWLLYTLAMLGVYYGRLMQLTDIYGASLFGKDLSTLPFALYGSVSFLFDSLLSILIATSVALYAGAGLTLTVGFLYSIGSNILTIFGLGFLFPGGYASLLDQGVGLLPVLGGSSLVTLVYALLLIALSLNFFKRVEF